MVKKLAFSALTLLMAYNAQAATLFDVRFGEHPNKTRVVLDLSQAVNYQVSVSDSGNETTLNLVDTRAEKNDANIQSVRGAVTNYSFRNVSQSGSQLVFKTHSPVKIHKSFILPPNAAGVHRLVLDLVARPTIQHTAKSTEVIADKIYSNIAPQQQVVKVEIAQAGQQKDRWLPTMQQNEAPPQPRAPQRGTQPHAASAASSGSNIPEFTFDISRYAYNEPSIMKDISDPLFVSAGVRKWDKHAANDTLLRLLYTGDSTIGWASYAGSGEYEKTYYKLRGEGYLGIALADNITPFIGLGYRWLYDDGGEQTTSTGALTYDRLSQYVYVPIGSVYKVNDKISLKAQYNLFISGKQMSYFSDYAGYSDAKNVQKDGWGLDLTGDFRINEKFSLYSYFRYWDIDRSDTTAVTLNGSTAFSGYEPANTTSEIGVGVAVQF